MITLVIAVVLALGGGVSFAAENAVPGDALYGVKTSVNENVRAALAVGTEADAHWDTKVAERRLREAEKLSVRGELTADIAAELGAEFRSSAEAALQAASKLAAEGNTETATEVVAEIDAMIDEHANIFANVQGNTSTGASVHLSGVLNAIRVKASNALNIRVGAGDVNSDGYVQTGDVDGDGKADVTISGSTEDSTSVKADADGSASASSSTRIEGSTKINLEL